MASSAEWWSGDTRMWRIAHFGENGPHGLEVDGELPESFASISAEMSDAQRAEGGDNAEVDYIFEIPLRTAQSLVGFKHDEDYASVVESSFIALSQASKKQGFFSRIFGKYPVTIAC